jgi:hypothetical protein
MMLAEAEHVEAKAVGKLDLLEQLSQALGDTRGRRAEGYVGKCGETQFHEVTTI